MKKQKQKEQGEYSVHISHSDDRCLVSMLTTKQLITCKTRDAMDIGKGTVNFRDSMGGCEKFNFYSTQDVFKVTACCVGTTE
jgi:hypothetical protein